MTIVLTHPAGRGHATPPGHPERASRHDAVARALETLDGIDVREAPMAGRSDILRCHPEEHVASIEAAIPESGHRPLDEDTHVSPGSLEAAMRAVGACCAAVDLVVSGEARSVFAAMRPPGHHAETARAMGFCLFGNIAIAAKRALDFHGLARVAVVDFDVHHGNGTQDLLWREARALFASSHQMPLYPGSGDPGERGAHGNVLNVPLAPMTGGAEMRRAYDEAILPAIADFKPELILVSAGFDAHAADPLASLNWTTEDFAWLTGRIRDTARELCGGRLVSTLEGGYDLDALEAGVAAHVEALKETAA